MTVEFVAVDGEADAQGNYILLCDSTGRVLHNPAGIDSKQAFDFLLPLRAKHRQVVCFGLNYDANQWCKDLRPGYLRRLSEDGACTWNYRYKLTWWPSKYFGIRDNKTGQTVKVCEVFGFFQTSFVKALQAWGFTPPSEIETMKRKRGTFTAGELDRVIRYCQAECALLVKLMDALASACATAECSPRRDWIGAGAIASSLLASHGVKHAHTYDRDIAERSIVEDYILGAYFGGRVEMLAQGVMYTCHTRDLRSAYPYAATSLPSLLGAKVVTRKRFDPSRPGIWRVRWDSQAHGQLAPFPVRTQGRAISYPRSGEGTYHTVEVATVMKLGYKIDVLGGVVLRVGVDGEPFDWVPKLYAHRAVLKSRGDPAEKALKLGLNSVYGKLAQGFGHGQPPFQSYWWAGMITAATRARMLELAHKSKHPCMISTDGLFAWRPGTRGSTRATLGSWEPDRVDNLFCAQPGVYRGWKGDREIVKSRGFFAREVDYGELHDAWRDGGSDASYSYSSRRFIGLRVALHRNRLDLWRQWVDERRTLSLEPERKVVTGERHPQTGMLLLYPPYEVITSVPYRPKQSLYDDPTDDDLENMISDDQPHYQETGE